jgi:hypothetical protein
MLWRFSVLGTLLLACTTVHQGTAQTTVYREPAPTVWIGPMASMSATSFFGNGVSANALTGVSVGGAVTIPFCNADCFFEAQGLYATKGSQSTGSAFTAQVKTSYLEVPILFGLYLQPPEDGPRLYAVAGPYLALLTSCRISASGSSLAGEGDCEQAGVIPRSIDVGATLGAGLDIKLGRNLLTLQARFEMGFTRVAAGYSARNSGVSAGVGYFFGAGH